MVSWRRSLWRKWRLLLTSLTDVRCQSGVVATRSVKGVTSFVDVSYWRQVGLNKVYLHSCNQNHCMSIKQAHKSHWRQIDSVVVATKSVKEVTSLVDVSYWPSSGWQWCRGDEVCERSDVFCWRLLLTSGWHINWNRGNEVSEGSDVSCWRLFLTSGWHHKSGIVATGSVLSTMTSCLSDWRQFYTKSKVSSRQLALRFH